VDSKGCIIAGHDRYLASIRLGLETVPVILLDHLSEIEKRAYLLSEGRNRRMHSNGRVRSGRIRHNGPTPRRKAGDHGD